MSPGERSIHVLYTIGHSNLDVDEFVLRLKANEVGCVADVRSSPYSERFPLFNRESLAAVLGRHGIGYLFLGDQLGGRPKDPRCYVGGQVDYRRTAAWPGFQAGTARLLKGLAAANIAIMCAEKDPLGCHRMILICRNLRDKGIAIKHILEDGRVEDHRQTERRLVAERFVTRTLFEPELTFDDLVERAYDQQGAAIAYEGGAVEAAPRKGSGG